MRRLLTLLTVGSVISVLACGGEESETQAVPTDGGATLSEAFWAAAPPAESMSVKEAKDGAKDGDVIAIRGRLKDFSEHFAQVTLIDLSMRPCNAPDDPMGETCPTPWDYCCIDVDTKTAHTVTLEFRDGALPIERTVRHFHALDHLDDVVASGTVRRDAGGNLILVTNTIARAR